MTTYERRRPEETGTETADMSSGAASGYVNPYAGQIQDIYQSITEREPFQYDVNADVMYQNLRDQYITGGQMAMMDTMGQAAQLTGGYGNSYAQGVGQQAYQGYLRGLNDQIPDLYDMALQNYIHQGDAMLQQYGMLQDMAADDYGKYIDDRNFGYQQEQDQAAADRWQQEFDYAQEQDQADRDYQAQQDAREMAMAMLEAGTMPSAEMLAAAGFSQEFADAMLVKKTAPYSPPEVTKITTAELGDIIYEMGAAGASIDEMYDVINNAYSTGAISEGNPDMWKQTAREMWGKG